MVFLPFLKNSKHNKSSSIPENNTYNLLQAETLVPPTVSVVSPAGQDVHP